MGMNDRCFIDSNIFLYTIDKSDTEKQKTAIQFLIELSRNEEIILSTQVAKEFSNIALRKLKFSSIALSEFLNELKKYFVSDVSINTIQEGLKIRTRFDYSFYDSFLLASATENNCKYFYSEDLNHGQSVDGPKIINPFLN
jgi:predicted nucleic acid-binding protein